MLTKWIAAKFVMFNHYTLYGSYDSGSAWGTKSRGDSPVAASPKFRSICDWLSTSH
jgi:hypothetical protein